VALTLKDLKGSVDVLGRQVLPIGLSRRSFFEKMIIENNNYGRQTQTLSWKVWASSSWRRTFPLFRVISPIRSAFIRASMSSTLSRLMPVVSMLRRGALRLLSTNGFPLIYSTGSSLMFVHKIFLRSSPILSSKGLIACCVKNNVKIN